jgi:hypothetical protein
MTFGRHTNFSLNPVAWGQGLPQDIAMLLDSVITDFYSNLDLGTIPNTPVIVCSDLLRNPPTGRPEIIKANGMNLIFLSTKDLLWSKYSYQFSHELCHFVINTPFPPANDKFGWFEESLCELASLYTLTKMAITWQTNPPYQNWTGYSAALNTYVTEIVAKPENTLTKTFSVWLSENLPALFLNRFKRTENGIVAVHLLPLFTANPDLWKTIQFLNPIQVADTTTFEIYLDEWKKNIPVNLHILIDTVITLLIGTTNGTVVTA